MGPIGPRFRGVDDLQGLCQLLARIGECKWPKYLWSQFSHIWDLVDLVEYTEHDFLF